MAAATMRRQPGTWSASSPQTRTILLSCAAPVSLQVADGRVDDAAVLAERLLDIPASGRLAQFLLGLRDAREGDYKEALQRIDAIERESVYALLLPLTEAWMHTGTGSDAEALTALAPLGDRDAYRPFFNLHAGLINDLAGREADAEALLRDAVVNSTGSHRPVAALGSLLMRAGAHRRGPRNLPGVP